MDPMLGYDAIASKIMEKYGDFSCRFCYSELIWAGKNGSSTKDLGGKYLYMTRTHHFAQRRKPI